MVVRTHSPEPLSLTPNPGPAGSRQIWSSSVGIDRIEENSMISFSCKIPNLIESITKCVKSTLRAKGRYTYHLTIVTTVLLPDLGHSGNRYLLKWRFPEGLGQNFGISSRLADLTFPIISSININGRQHADSKRKTVVEDSSSLSSPPEKFSQYLYLFRHRSPRSSLLERLRLLLAATVLLPELVLWRQLT